MRRLILLVAVVALSFGTFSCGGGAGPANIPSGENPGIPSVVQLLPSHFVAQTNSNITLHAKVLDGNGVPLSGVAVSFTNLSEPFGRVFSFLGISKPKVALSASVVNTDANGIATVNIFSSVAGFATVQAEVNTGVGLVRAKKTVSFSDTFGLPVSSTVQPQLTLDVDTDPSFASPDDPGDFILFKSTGDNQRYIRATISFDTSVNGKIVTFGSDNTDLTFSNGANEIVVITDNNGQATVLATVNPAALSEVHTPVTITASANDGASNVLTLFLEPVVIDPSASSLSASPNPVLAGKTSTITANVKLAIGGPAPDGTTVNFTATCGTVDAFAQTTVGTATATFTAPATVPAGGVCTVAGKVAGVSIGSVPITILPATSNTLTIALDKLNVIGIPNPDSDPSDDVTLTVTGGVPPYVVQSSNPALTPGGPWPLATSGATAVTDVNSVGATTAVTFTVYDNVGTTATATLTIFPQTTSNTLTIALDKLNVIGIPNPDSDPSDDVTLTVTGGVPPYVVTSSNSALTPGGPWPLATSGATAVTDVNNVGATTAVTFTVHDNVGASATAVLSIYPQTTGLVISVDKLDVIGLANPDNLAADPTADDITFTVTGGTAPYIVSKGACTVNFAKPSTATLDNGPWVILLSGGTYTIDPNFVVAATTCTLTATDNHGAIATTTVTIHP